MTDDLLSDEQLDALWATLGPTPTDADFARAAIKAHMDALAKRGLEDLRDAVFEHLHKAIGYCGHCGKKTCAGKQSNSKLPESIPTRLLVEAFDAAATKGDSSVDR